MRDLTKEDINVKVKQINAKGCLLLLYKTARVDAQILDEEYPNRWMNEYKEIKGNLFCGIGVRQDNGDVIWRWDCGIESITEAEKGEASDAFKRAGFKWGIGVELYSAPFIWANVETKKNDYNKYELADKFMKFSVDNIEITNKKITALRIVDNKGNVVFEMGKRISKPKSDFEKEASKEAAANTKARNKAIANGETYERKPLATPLQEQFEKAVSWLKGLTPAEFYAKKASAMVKVNNLIEDLRKANDNDKADEIQGIINNFLEDEI